MEKTQIGNLQFIVIACLFTIGDSILFIPSLVATAAGKDAWLAGLFALISGMGLLLFYTVLQRRYPRQTILALCDQLLGRYVGRAVSAAFVFVFLLLVASTLLREVGDFMATQILPNTPVQFIEMLFMLIVVRAVRGGAETIGRTAQIVAPWVLLLLVLLVLFVIPGSRISMIEPVLYNGVKPVISGGLQMIAVPYMEIASMMILFPLVRNDRRVRLNFVIGGALGGVILALVIFFCLANFGALIIRDSVYPTYLLAKKIELGEFLQRIEAIMAIAWMFSLFVKMAVCFYGTCVGAAHVLGLRDYRLFTFPLALLLLPLADMLAPNIIAYFRIAEYYPFFAGTFAVALPLALLAAGKVRGGRGRRREARVAKQK
ncbi:GerAB/ArcD/ProY family transporter [Paenibacillus methanolicus]|uniref:Spore germination protein KB n=1 Tax=Paenibacillus methanolicus TaxID=582686 RepID=A0A5S5C815_9BACL|nr:endospore germination permease [Paenibacillus methanolicus]TYP75484.1 spore germination protein KB [Paenibacillus methanolicus]